tara:strand:+ start:201 stop:371 length:171 start_codon:yes stop_codon:yes gene_type:complete
MGFEGSTKVETNLRDAPWRRITKAPTFGELVETRNISIAEAGLLDTEELAADEPLD